MDGRGPVGASAVFLFPIFRRQPRVRVRFGGTWFDGTARIVEGATEDPLVRQALLDKYQPGDSDDLRDWAARS